MGEPSPLAVRAPVSRGIPAKMLCEWVISILFPNEETGAWRDWVPKAISGRAGSQVPNSWLQNSCSKSWFCFLANYSRMWDSSKNNPPEPGKVWASYVGVLCIDGNCSTNLQGHGCLPPSTFPFIWNCITGFFIQKHLFHGLGTTVPQQLFSFSLSSSEGVW
jgi:hypothetical protein